jgi:multisubunit Na+/H+ antiporter MnhC subunit
MSVEVRRSGKDSAIVASRLALAVVLTAIVAAFCLTALLVQPLSANSERPALHAVSVAAHVASASPQIAPRPSIAGHSGYGIDE